MVTAVNAALDAGKEIMDIYTSGRLDIETKKDDSPLTRADRKAHLVITRALEQTNLPILSEEGKDIPWEERGKWSRYWCVDPLDGTKEFIRRNGEFTVNIALIDNQKSTNGIVYAPATEELYLGISGAGAWKLNHTTAQQKPTSLEALLQKGKKLPLQPSVNDPFTIVGSRSHMNEPTREIISTYEKRYPKVNVISRGSSLKICMVAEGTADFYPRFAPTMEWDTAAGHAVAQCAGMLVTTADLKSPLLYNKKNLTNPWFVVRKKEIRQSLPHGASPLENNPKPS